MKPNKKPINPEQALKYKLIMSKILDLNDEWFWLNSLLYWARRKYAKNPTKPQEK
jgi:hypothetical protein